MASTNWLRFQPIGKHQIASGIEEIESVQIKHLQIISYGAVSIEEGAVLPPPDQKEFFPQMRLNCQDWPSKAHWNGINAPIYNYWDDLTVNGYSWFQVKQYQLDGKLSILGEVKMAFYPDFRLH